MAIFIGAVAASAIYVGAQAVQRVYRGDQLVWEGGEPEPDAIVVEGAGNETLNTVAVRDGFLNTRPKYQTGEAILIAAEILTGTTPQQTFWVIYRSGGFGFLGTYENLSNVATPDLATNWTVVAGQSAQAPAPTTVRRATWADIDNAGIDRSTVPLLQP